MHKYKVETINCVSKSYIFVDQNKGGVLRSTRTHLVMVCTSACSHTFFSQPSCAVWSSTN